MKKLSVLLIIILFSTILIMGCTQSKTADTSEQIKDSTTETNEKDNFNESNKEKNTEENKDDEESDVVEIVNEGIKSPLSGLYGPEEKVNRRPIAVMLDNFKTARWQAGLSQAEIVYEILAEGKITRYMALFLKNDPNLIGPIRSARPYYITKSLEYDAVYAHCGASTQAYEDIKNLEIADLDEITNAGYAYFRYYDTGKKNEHTLYSTMEKLRDAQEKRGFKSQGDFEPFKFYEEDTDIEGINADTVLIKYYSNNTTKYIYDRENKVYTRYKDGELHVDEYDNSKITAKNIIIQNADTVVIDSYGRRDIKLIGEGKGKFVTNGKSIEVSWQKDSRDSKTKYYDENGIEITLNPGVTWIQVIQNSTDITIK